MKNMTKKLKSRFVKISMSAITAVIAVIAIAMNLATAVSNKNLENQTIDMIYNNGGSFPSKVSYFTVYGSGAEDVTGTEEESRTDVSNNTDSGNIASNGDYQSKEPPSDSRFSDKSDNSGSGGSSPFYSIFTTQIIIDEDTKFRTRYFTVKITGDGSIGEISMDHIASVSSEKAVNLTQEVLYKGRTTGLIDDYRYKVYSFGDGSRYIIFLNRTVEKEYQRNLIAKSLLVSVGGLIAVFIIIELLSPKAIKPFVDNINEQKRFITDAGHEIKTPVAIISANADVLSMTGNDNEWVRSIKHQTARLSDLVSDLVTLSKLDEEGRQLGATRFDMSSAVKNAVEEFSTLAEVKEKSIKANIQDGIVLTGDEKNLEKLINIFLDNAIKYSIDNSEIKVSLIREGKNAVYSVTNSCDNVNKDDVGKLFDRFYRSDKSRSRMTGGNGIGLSMAKAITQSHGGKIKASLDNGKITFTSIIPIRLDKQVKENKNI